jgi:hypothetical protein
MADFQLTISELHAGATPPPGRLLAVAAHRTTAVMFHATFQAEIVKPSARTVILTIIHISCLMQWQSQPTACPVICAEQQLT